ncbi:putative K+-dependent Na+/Ca+ exchanger related-protein [Calothrix parasitica NIES-267]|uniref:Putative K+-dependent Na+/Ca+ exchanger related-protein n=1 Tax=Calothrix parasitica NIES-267 TaxID=1973488 RepID=A0A1Z4LLB2_9CYAN|nr:putative K+-dependent Na+/Ca+ exchanger related-protein [Calothrix parasitica NIES-267]
MDALQLILYIGLIAASTAVVWKGSSILESAAEGVSEYYQLPPVVQGSVVVAIGSSFPELSSTVLATLVHGQFDLGVAAIVGSAIFNILVIPGISGLVGQRLNADRLLVYKDAQFYITSITILLLAFTFAIIYNPVPGEILQGEMNRLIALMPLSLYGLYLFLQQQDTIEEKQNNNHQPPQDINIVKEWLLLLFSLFLIVVSVEGLVSGAIGLGKIFNTPSFLWGITVIAAATSLPDAFVSIRAAKRGDGIISLANVLGSNIFDLLVAIPVGIMIAGASIIDFAVAAPMMGVLTLATIVLFAMLRTGLVLTKKECVVLLGMYGLFIIWMVLETFEITNVI